MPSVGDLGQMINALSSGNLLRSESQMAVAVKGKEVMEQQGRNALGLIEAAATGKGARIDARA